jgi:hypothetical protein
MDSSAFSYPFTNISVLDALEAASYEQRMENLLAISPERLRKEIEVIEDIRWGISNNNLSFISEVVKEIAVYRKNLARYNKFSKGIPERVRFEMERKKVKNLKEKAMLIQWLVDELNQTWSEMHEHDPREHFEEQEKRMYEKLVEMVTQEMAMYKETPRYGQGQLSIGQRLQTDTNVIATALTLSCTIPTYIVTRDMHLLHTARLIRAKIQKPEIAAVMPMSYNSTLKVLNAAYPSIEESSPLILKLATC